MDVAKPLTATSADADLLERALGGDEHAVRVLTTRYNQRLYRIARSILRNDTEAEDVVQDTYVRAFTGIQQFRGDAELATWLTRIAINEALGRLRRRRPTEEVVDMAAPDAAGPEHALAQLELQHLLERSIDRLPEAFRVVFVARIVEGLSIEDTARLFGLRPETVKTRVHRARARLRTDLSQKLGSAADRAFAFDGRRCERMTERVVATLAQRASAEAQSNLAARP